MGDLQQKSYGKLTILRIITLLFIAWSAGSIGVGMWQLFLISDVTTTQTSTSDSPDFARVPDVTTGVFQYGGSTAWAALRLRVDSVIQSERPELQLRYLQPQKEPPGSSPGIKMLLAGELDFVQTARSLSEEELKLADQKGLKLVQIPVAIDSIAIAVHPQLDITGLTLQQLQKMYTGEIINWQEIGGVDLKITAYSRPNSAGGTVDFFTTKILQNKNFGSNVEFVSTTTQALRRVAENPGAIYYGSTSAIIPQCIVKPLSVGIREDSLITPYQEPLVTTENCPPQRNQLNVKALRTAVYPLTYYLYVVFVQNEERRSRVGRAYADFLLTPQGQELIEEAGFIALER